MKTCQGAVVGHVKKHVVVRHLPRSFGLWVEMSKEERMQSLNKTIRTVFMALDLSTPAELLEHVVQQGWYPKGTKFSISEEEEEAIRDFHFWSTGKQLEVTPLLDPPNCMAHWRLMSTVINCTGEGKVGLTGQEVTSPRSDEGVDLQPQEPI